jgi:hypothetical protein
MMTEEHKAIKQPHDKERSLTEKDIMAIITALREQPTPPHLFCRFEKVSEEDFYASVEFFKEFNVGLKAGKAVAAKTILVLLITFLCGIFGAGIIGKFKGQ